MQPQDEHTTYIRNAFNTMKTQEDFLALLNYAKLLVYGEKAIPFTQKQINYNSNAKANKKRYFKFSVKKKSGGERVIHAPSKGLKAIQKCLNLVFQTIYEPSPAATGFVPGKSIVDNARVHAGSFYVYNIDLKDFFPGIEAGRIWNRLQHPPFNLTEKTGRKELANTITWLCCHEMEVERLDENKQWQKVVRNVLPQGAPTSPTLTNIICQQLDYYFTAVAKSFGLRYSRYADDITFSSMHNVYQVNSAIKNKKGQTFLAELQRIITEQYFYIKDSKTRLQKEGHRQMVTGLVVNEKASVPKRYIKQLRVWLYYWEQYGYDRASSYFLPEYVAEKGHVKKSIPDMANVIEGKLQYLKMVKGRENETYLKLMGRFEIVSKKESYISTFLNVWESEGIDTAIFELNNLKKIEVMNSKSELLSALLRNKDLSVSDKEKIFNLTAKEYSNNSIEIEKIWKEINKFSEISNNIHLANDVTQIINVNDKIEVNDQDINLYEDDDDEIDIDDFYDGEEDALDIDLVDFNEGDDDDLGIDLNDLHEDEDDDVDSYTIDVENLHSEEILIINTLDNVKKESVNNEDESFQKRKENLASQGINYNNNLPIIHTPKELVNLLKKFSINNSALKYTTHSWDAGRDANLFKDLSEFLSKAKIEYNKFSFNLKTLSENLNGKIYNFLFNRDISKKGWGDINRSKRIYFGWSSPELLDACRVDASLNPEDYILPSNYQLQRAGKTLQKFKHVIDVFKNEIEIRDENSALLNIILQKHDTFLLGFADPIISNLDNKTFYTDVQWLSKALDMIFENIQMRPQNSMVSYSLNDQRDDAYVLEILHINSYNSGKSINDEKLQLAKGNFGDICEYLKNLCDWSIESQFTEGFYRINYLVSDKEIQAHQKIESTQGFKHILTFYK